MKYLFDIWGRLEDPVFSRSLDIAVDRYMYTSMLTRSVIFLK